MRNKCAALLLIALLCLSACGNVTPPEETDFAATRTTESTTEEVTTQKQYPAPKPPETLDTDYAFTTTWAKTPAHFYAVILDGSQRRLLLSRVPLGDITKAEALSPPEEYKGHALESINVCGVTEQWLFIDCNYENRESDTWSNIYVLFRISLETLESEVMEDGKDYRGNTWYNAGSNSLLFYGYEGVFGTLRLDTGERSEIEMPDFYGMLWHNTTDGLVVCGLEGTPEGDDAEVVVIDSENNAAVVPLKSLKLIPRPWERETPIDVPPNDQIKELLDFEDEQGNVGYGLQRMDDMILVLAWSIYGNYDGYFEALYDPAAGAMFSAE